MGPVTPDNLAYRGSALDAFDELASNQKSLGLFHATHVMWCGDSCSRDLGCPFLHYTRPRSGPPTITNPTQAPRHRYNKHTANLFTLMGGEGYQAGVSQKHRVNFWPLCEDVLQKVDQARERSGLLFCDYTDWTKKQDHCSEMTVRNACRDTVQWMAAWCGSEYNATQVGMRTVAAVTIPDDLCIPPLDLMHQRFRIYGLSLRDLIEEMVKEGWGRDATHILLATIRQYFVQYIEKVEFKDTINENDSFHTQISRTNEVWDSIVYRTHSANTYATAVIVGRGSVPTLQEDWLACCSINCCLSMDLAKSALSIYEQDNHMPTASFGIPKTRRGLHKQRKTRYHSVYLDLEDDIANNGCPELLAHFASSGFLYVQLHHRYLERGLGRRIPVHKPMAAVLHSKFGDKPTDAWLDGIFHLRWLMENYSSENESRPTLCPDLLAACLKRKRQRQSLWNLQRADNTTDPTSQLHNQGTHCQCATDWIADVHMLSRQASNPDELQKLLTSVITQDSAKLSIEQLNTVGSRDDLWALCVACQVDCSDDCEWLAFAKYTWGRLCSASHTTQICPESGLQTKSGRGHNEGLTVGIGRNKMYGKC
ncbi:hypothetical protein F5Y04DRAFT_261924 [Hypomontagnella monticulosa]|nr:hypothetical protein F5Y04DRAFT_261924 [Hypomontagnella monticulosa]